jgi:hypothetical protein
MATQRTSFAKLQRDRDKQAKAAEKRVRRQERSAAKTEEPVAPSLDGDGDLNAAELLSLVESIHRQFEAGDIDFETFEEMKGAVMARLPVD